MYITVAIADEHLTIRERTSSPVLHISLHTLQCTNAHTVLLLTRRKDISKYFDSTQFLTLIASDIQIIFINT